MAALVTQAEVLDRTGAAVTDAQILQAQGIVEVVTGFDFTDPEWPTLQVAWPRDQTKIRRAISYQAAFIAAHPDVFTSSDIVTSMADGASQTYKDLGTVLSPLAKMALRRLTKNRSRSIRAHAGHVFPLRYDGTGPVPDWTDAFDNWQPMS